MKDFSETMEEDEVPLCPLCDQPMEFIGTEIAIGRAHGLVFMAHQDCNNEAKGEEVENF